MKKLAILIVSVALLTACGNGGNTTDTTIDTTQPTVAKRLTAEELENKEFNEIFVSVKPTEVKENVFKIFAEDYAVITSGNSNDYNSMVASYGGWGILFNEPATWCFLRANRYTLEYIRKNQTYTLSYFDDEDKSSIMNFGTVSGRESDKMKTHQLHAVETPDGTITYKEARIVVECELSQITTVSPDDYYLQKGKDFVIEGYEDAKEYHKLVFGQIKNIWVRR